MSYLQDRKKSHQRKKIWITVVVIATVLIISFLGVFKSMDGFLNIIGRPLWKADNTIGTLATNSGSILSTKKSVYRENNYLKEKQKEIELRLSDYEILKKENEDLKVLLGRIPKDENFILSTILVKPNQSPYDTIIIDIGKDNNIILGTRVFANGDIPIGEVREVYERTSLVALFSSPGEKINAQIEGLNAPVEIVGRGGGNFEMTIPHEMEVTAGMYVVLPSFNSKIVAIVADIISDERDPLSKVILRSPVNIQDLKWVQVQK